MSSPSPSAPASGAPITDATLDATIAALELTHTAVLQRIRADAAASERRRIESIRSLGMPGKERLVQLCIDSPTCTPEIAAAVLIKASRDEPSMQAALERIEKGLAILDPHGTIARS